MLHTWSSVAFARLVARSIRRKAPKPCVVPVIAHLRGVYEYSEVIASRVWTNAEELKRHLHVLAQCIRLADHLEWIRGCRLPRTIHHSRCSHCDFVTVFVVPRDSGRKRSGEAVARTKPGRGWHRVGAFGLRRGSCSNRARSTSVATGGQTGTQIGEHCDEHRIDDSRAFLEL